MSTDRSGHPPLDAEARVNLRPTYGGAENALLAWLSLSPLLFSLLAVMVATACNAATVPVGVLSFDVLIPPDRGSPGVNSFTIANLTGDPVGGGFALPPGFPVLSSLALLDVQLRLNGQVFVLDDIGPGTVSPDTLLYSDTHFFSAGIFSAWISQTTLALADGTTFLAASPLVSVTLAPSSGSNLQPGTDFVLITISDIPEPGTYSLAFAAICAMVASRRQYKCIER